MSNIAEPFLEEIFHKENLAPLKYQPLTGGAVNMVYRVDTAQGRYVIRLNQDSAATYRKERWAMGQASAVGVPTPKVYAVGSYDT